MSYRALSAAALLCAATTAVAAPRVFTPADIIDWKRHSFDGETRYELVEVDGRQAVHAVCDADGASGLFFRVEADLSETPVLEWRWRVDEVLAGVDETTKSGDDYPARIYAVDEHSILRWRTRALNYVWSAEQPRGSDWPNAFASQARMIAVESGAPAEKGGWITERRNLRADFRRYHDRELDTVDAIGIMTDCDNTGQDTEAWYGEIRLLPGE